jgi:ATP-dependent RNA helicase SUPV3L1/SUV3
MPAGLGDIAEVAKLKPGPEPSKPQVEVLPSEFLDGAQRERIRERIASWLEAHIKRELGAVFAAEAKAAEDNTLRGPAFRLREELGLAMGRTDPDIRPDLRQKLKGIGIRAGRYALFVPEAMKPRAMALRAQLWSLLRGVETPKLPGGGLIAVPAREDWPRGFAETMGWLPAGPVLLRLDVAERIAGELGHLTRRAPAMLPGDLASRLGVKGDALGPVLDAMGFRLIPAETLEEGQFGPPCPARIAHARPPRHEHPRRDGRGQQRGADQPRGERQEQGPRGDRRGRDRHPNRPPRDDRPAAAPGEAPTEAAAEGATPPEAGAEAPRPARQDPRPPRQDQRPPRDQRQGKGGPWQGDRDRDRGPRRPREDRPALPAMPRPDSPFAVLANLLKKD